VSTLKQVWAKSWLAGGAFSKGFGSSGAHMVKASCIAIAIGTTPISMLWRKFTDRAKAMDSTRSLWRCAGWFITPN
jgi:hypothetical protein